MASIAANESAAAHHSFARTNAVAANVERSTRTSAVRPLTHITLIPMPCQLNAQIAAPRSAAPTGSISDRARLTIEAAPAMASRTLISP